MAIKADQIKLKVRLLQALWTFVILFQALVLAGLIDYQYVSGGRISSFEEAKQMLPIGIILLMVFVFILERFYQGIKSTESAQKWLRGIVLIIGLYSILNTVGNLMAETLLEKLLFSPITVISAIFCIQMAVKSGKA